MGGQQIPGLVIRIEDQVLDGVVDDPGGLLTEILGLGDLPAQEDVFVPFPKVTGPIRRSCPIAHHLAGQIGGPFQVVAGAGGEMLEDQLLGGPAPNRTVRTSTRYSLG